MTGLFLAGAMMCCGNPEKKEEAGKKDAEAAWVSLAPEKGMGKWKAINFGGEGDTIWKDGVLTINEGAELTGAAATFL